MKLFWLKIKLALQAMLKILNSQDYIWLEIDGRAWSVKIREEKEDGVNSRDSRNILG